MGAERKTNKILVIHGPNLNTLGTRETDIYGSTSLSDINSAMKAYGDAHGCDVSFFQSNHEGAIIDALQDAVGKIDGLIINPAAFTHTSIAIRDALLLLDGPIIEVHLSNIHRRESFRHRSMMADVATGQIVGLGVAGYNLALQAVISFVAEKR